MLKNLNNCFMSVKQLKGISLYCIVDGEYGNPAQL